MRPWQRSVGPALGIAVGLTLAACSASASPTASPSATPTAGGNNNSSTPGSNGGGGTSGSSAPPCSSITAADVGAAVGYAVSDATTTGDSGNEVCLYQPTSQPVPVRVQLQVTTLSVFQGSEAGYSTGVTPLSGVGEGAFSLASIYVGNGENEVVAFDKGLEVTVTAVASVDQITSLVNMIFSKL
jgi:hypothetical protein